MRKIVTRSAYGIGAAVVLLVAAALILPEVLDMPAVERELQAKLSEAAQGQVAWEKLSIRFLPSPHGALRKVRIEIPGVAKLRTEDVAVHLRLAPLFHGRAEIASIALSKPEIQLDLTEASGSEESPRDKTQENPSEGYRSTVEAIRGFAPETFVDVEDASVDARISGMPRIHVRALDLRVRTGGKTGLEGEVDLRAGSVELLRDGELVQVSDVTATAKISAKEREISVELSSVGLGTTKLAGASLRYSP